MVPPAEAALRDCRPSHTHTEQERNNRNSPTPAETADRAETAGREGTEGRADTAAPATRSAVDHMSVQVLAMHNEPARNAIAALRDEARTTHHSNRTDEIRERHVGA